MLMRGRVRKSYVESKKIRLTSRVLTTLILFTYVSSLIFGIPIKMPKAEASIITNVGSTTKSHIASGAPIVIDKPTSTAQDDVMIALIGVEGQDTTITPPAGWNTFTNSTTLYTASGTPYAKIFTFWKAATGSEPTDYSFAVGVTGNYAGGISTYRGVDTVSPIDVAGGNNTNSPNSDTSPQATTITPGADNAMLITVFGAFNLAVRNYTAPSGMTERIDVGSNNVLNNDISIGLFDQPLPNMSATGSRTGTLNGAGRWVAHQFTLKPSLALTHMLLFWDGTDTNGTPISVPPGWSIISAYDGRFPRAEDPANFGTTGGTSSHTPTVSSLTMSTNHPSNSISGGSGTVATVGHTHNNPSQTIGSSNHLPANTTLRIIRYDYGIPNVIPVGGIAIFDSSPNTLPVGWQNLASGPGDPFYQRMIQVAATAGTQSGSDTHTHNITWGNIAGSTSGSDGAYTFLCSNNPAATYSHTHTMTSPTTIAAANNIPPYFQPKIAKANVDTATLSIGLTSMFDGDPGGGWVIRSKSSGSSEETQYYQKFLRPSSTFSATGGLGAVTHSHPQDQVTSGQASNSSTGCNGIGLGTISAVTHTHTMTTTFNPNDTNIPPYFNVVIAEKVNFILNAYYWYENNNALTPTNRWGTPDVSASGSIVTLPIAAADPPDLGRDLRLRIQILINGNNLAASVAQFKLQYNATKSQSCTTLSGSWTDLGSSSDTDKAWRYTTSTSITDGSTLWTAPNNSVFSPQSSRAQTYARSAPTAPNPNGANIGETIEYDFHIQNYAADSATQYSFRILESNGTLLSQYDVCPTLTTRPRTENQLRHGNFFETNPAGDSSVGLEGGFSWVD